MEIVVHSKKSLFQQKFQKKLYLFNSNSPNPNLRVWCKNDPIGHLDSESDKKVRLPLVLGIRIRLHPKTSDSLRLFTTPIPQPWFPGAGKVHLKCSNKNFVKTNFTCRRQKRFDIFMWYQAGWFGRSIKTLLRRSGFDPRESFNRSVIACQGPETLLFSNFPWDGVSWVFAAKLVMFYLHTKCVAIVVIKLRGILENTIQSLHFAAFLKVFNLLHKSVLDFNSWKWSKISRCDQSDMIYQSNTMLPPAVQSSINSAFPDLTTTITGANPWTTDGKKTLPNLGSMAPK